MQLTPHSKIFFDEISTYTHAESETLATSTFHKDPHNYKISDNYNLVNVNLLSSTKMVYDFISPIMCVINRTCFTIDNTTLPMSYKMHEIAVKVPNGILFTRQIIDVIKDFAIGFFHDEVTHCVDSNDYPSTLHLKKPI